MELRESLAQCSRHCGGPVHLCPLTLETACTLTASSGFVPKGGLWSWEGAQFLGVAAWQAGSTKDLMLQE